MQQSVAVLLLLLYTVQQCIASDSCMIHTCASSGQPCGEIDGKIVGCSNLNSYCPTNTKNPKCIPLPGVNEECANTDTYHSLCGVGLTCDAGVCLEIKYHKTAGTPCKSNEECFYIIPRNLTTVHLCENGKCYGPKIGEACLVNCAEGYCDRRVCVPFLPEGSECASARECEVPNVCAPQDASDSKKKCVFPKTVPEGGFCYHSGVCAGDNVCIPRPGTAVGVCGPINKKTHTYGKPCTSDKDCSAHENCKCDFSTGKQTCTPFELPFTDNVATFLTDLYNCTTNYGCSEDGTDDECFFEYCANAFCGYIQEPTVVQDAKNSPYYCYTVQAQHLCTVRDRIKRGAVPGIIIGALILLGIVAGVAFYVYKRITNRREARYSALRTDEDTMNINDTELEDNIIDTTTDDNQDEEN